MLFNCRVMHVNQPDTLRVWLTNTLEPVCDADPAALAKYVMALLKKDKPVSDLKEFCLDQLEVFLQKETAPFVTKLFEAIESKSYLEKPVTSTDPAIVAQSIQTAKHESDSRKVHVSAPQPAVEPQSGGRKVIKRKPTPPLKDRLGDKDKTTKRDRKESSPSPNRKEREKDRTLRRGNNREAPVDKTGRHKDKRKLSRSRSSSPRDKRRHREASPAKTKTKESPPGGSENNGYKQVKTRCRDYDEKGYCMRGDQCPYDHGLDPVVVEETALPKMIATTNPPPPPPPPPPHNFAVPPPGYPKSSSTTNPPPPGVDGYASAPALPVSSNDAYNPEAPAMSGQPPPPAVVPQRFSHPPPPLAGMAYPPPNYPRPPSLTVTVGNIRPMDPHSNRRRVVGGGGAGVYGRLANPPVRPNYDNKTLQVRKVPFHLNNISKLNEHFQQFGHINNIQVGFDNDPEAALITFASRAQANAAYKSTQPILNNRFIKVFWHQPEQSQESPPKSKLMDLAIGVPQTQSEDTSNQGVQFNVNQGNLTKTVFNANAMKVNNAKTDVPPKDEPTDDGESQNVGPGLLPAQHQFVNKKREMLAAKKKIRAIKDNQKALLYLHKKKSELLSKQSEQLKMLMQQMEKAKDAHHKKAIMKMFYTVDEAIKKVREELGELGGKLRNLSGDLDAAQPRTKELVEKEKLDVELELLSQKEAGADVGCMQSKLSGLKEELLQLALEGSTRRVSQSSGEPTPLASSTPIAKPPPRKPAAPQTAAIDRRPRDVIVSGFDISARDAIEEQLQKFGPVEDLEFDCKIKDNCRALVVFKNRRDAEQVVSAGTALVPSMELTVSWGVKAKEDLDDSDGAIVPDHQRDPRHQLSATELLASLQDANESDNELEQ